VASAEMAMASTSVSSCHSYHPSFSIICSCRSSKLTSDHQPKTAATHKPSTPSDFVELRNISIITANVMGNISAIQDDTFPVLAATLATSSQLQVNSPVSAHHIDANVLKSITSTIEDQPNLNNATLSTIEAQTNRILVRYGRMMILRPRLPTRGKPRLDGRTENLCNQ
jgi:hypothetical protein